MALRSRPPLGVAIALLLVLPLLGVVSAILYVRAQPERYEGRIDLILTSIEGAYGSGETASAFSSVINDPSYKRSLAEMVAPADHAVDDLKVSNRGFGEAVAIELSNEDRSVVQTVLAAAARVAVERLYAPEIDETTDQLARLQEEYDNSNRLIEDLEDQAGGMEPDDRYNNLVDIVRRLKFDMSVDAAEGRTERRSSYETQLAEQERELALVEPIADEFDRVEARRDKLQNEIFELEIDLEQARSATAVIDLDQALDEMSVLPSNRREVQLRAGVLGMGMGLFVAAMTITAMALLRARREDSLLNASAAGVESRQEVQVG